MDIVLTLSIFHPSFVSKASVKKYPGIGLIAQAIDCLFLDRGGSKDDKLAMAR
jgi:lysophosphatidylcholine acyltransferase/lyso-PAF acetyltransferase